ncbi:MAG: glycosyltransferase [Thermodesulfobacteriota bacterium]|nr:glycosyltransferase [Thermodesulfobacteriota bacterium]
MNQPGSVFQTSVIILTYNRSAHLKHLLTTLQDLKYPSLEIIIVDNCSDDDTQQMVKSQFPLPKYIRTNKNLGASARNLGMKVAKGQVLVTLDDDIVGINDDHIVELVQVFNERPRIGAINFKVLDSNTLKICNWVHHCDEYQYGEKEFETYEITEGAVAFRKQALQKAGYYPHHFFLSYEGPDLALRIIDSGYDIIYLNTISVIHFHSDAGRDPWLNYYYDTRNQLWLAARNFPVSYSLVFLGRGILSMLVYSIRDGYFGYWIKAIVDGLKGISAAVADRKVISKDSLRIIRTIDRNRLPFFSLLKKRLFKRGVRL